MTGPDALAVLERRPDLVFHVSEEAGIARFEPRPMPRHPGNAVWAIDAAHLPHYLLPRDCPRACWARGAATTEADAARFASSAPRVIAVEWAWLARIRRTRLHVYAFDAAPFAPLDDIAGYVISRVGVTPVAVAEVDDVLRALAAREVELRIVPSLWPLHDAIAASSLDFSIIRMRNAAPR